MIYEHTMMFRLSTPPEAIQRALLDARGIAAQPLRHVEQEKRRERIRDVGNRVVRVVSFEFEGDTPLMEAMREKLWDGHEDIVSTLTIEHPAHERLTRYAPRRWEDAVDEWFRPGVDRPTYGTTAIAPPPPSGNDRFTKDALLDRFVRGEVKERKFTRPLPR